jgi:hypothetical protein
MPIFIATMVLLDTSDPLWDVVLTAIGGSVLFALPYLLLSQPSNPWLSTDRGTEQADGPIDQLVNTAGLLAFRVRGVFATALIVGAAITGSRTGPLAGGGYRTWLVIVVAVVGVYAAMWPRAVAAAVLSGAQIPPSQWPWLPLIATHGGWRWRRRRRRPRRTLAYWLLVLPAYLSRFLIGPWWMFEAWLDERTVRRAYGRALTADDLRELLGHLRHQAGVRELVSAVRRQALRCDPDGITFLEELAAQGEAPLAQQPRRLRSMFPTLRRPDWLESPELLSDRVLDQIALITEARMRGTGALASSAPSKPAASLRADTPVSPNAS